MRKDIKDYIDTMKIKGKDDIVLAEIARQYNCDYRTVKKYYNERDQDTKKKRASRVIKKKTDGFEDIIEAKVKAKAPAIAIYHVLRDNYGYTEYFTASAPPC